MPTKLDYVKGVEEEITSNVRKHARWTHFETMEAERGKLRMDLRPLRGTIFGWEEARREAFMTPSWAQTRHHANWGVI